MKFEIDREPFLIALKQAGSIIAGNPITPALVLAKMRLLEDSVEFVTSNMQSILWITAPCLVVEGGSTEVLVNPKMLAKYVAALPDGMATVVFDKDSMQITTGKSSSVLAVGKASEFLDLPSLSVLGDDAWVEVPKGSFFSDFSVVQSVVPFVSEMPQFSQIAVRENIWLSYDGKRVHAKPCAGYSISDFSIPKHAIKPLRGILLAQEYDTFDLAIADLAVVYRTPRMTLMAYNPSVPFAEVDGLLKQTALANSHAVQVERTDVLEALDRVVHTASPNGAVSIEIHEDHAVFSTSSTIGESKASISCVAEQEQTIYVRADYLREAFHVLPSSLGVLYLGDQHNVKGAKEISPVRVLTPPSTDEFNKFTAVFSQLKKDAL